MKYTIREIKDENIENFEDNVSDVELHYDDLEITVFYNMVPAKLDPIDEAHPEEWDQEDIKIEWDYQVNGEEVVEYFADRADEYEELINLPQEEVEPYIRHNFEKLCIKYEKDLLKHWEDKARENAEENYEPSDI